MADKSETVTEAAQTLVRTIGSDNLSAYFHERLKDKDLPSRPHLISAYAQLKGLSALPLLLDVVKDQTELIATRIAATKSLGSLAEEPALVNRAPLITAISNLLDDKDREVRSVAAVGLSALRVREAANRLRTLADSDQLNVIAREETLKFLTAIEATLSKDIIPVADRFFGREHELRGISEAFKNSKIVVLLGLNGIGKTTLAAKYADQSPYDVKLWLSGLSDSAPSGLAVEVMRQLESGWNEKSGLLPLTESLQTLTWKVVSKQILAKLSSSSVLMVIDDYQAISDKDNLADFVRTFTSQLRKIDCLITSRYKPKGLEATIIPVGALNHKDATALMKSELAELGTLPGVVSIDSLLELAEGNPLLIRSIAEEGVLATSGEVTSSKYESLVEYVLKRSTTGLNTTQQRALEVLAQFDEPVDLQSAILLTLFNDELITAWPEGLRELEQAGLIVNNNGRLSFVHNVLRNYVRRRVDARTTRRVNQTIASYYQKHGDTLRWRIHLARAEMKAAGADLISDKVLSSEDKAYASNARKILVAEMSRGDHTPFSNLNSVILIGDLSVSLGDLAFALESYEQAVEIARRINDKHNEGNALWHMSKVMYALGDHQKAVQRAETALAIYEQLKLPNAINVRDQIVRWREQE